MIYQFRDCELDTGRLEFRRGGVVQPLEPQVLRLLTHLIEHRDRVVTRNELYETIWNGRVVAESALYSRIKSVRAAIGDEGQAQDPIRTISRSGYQFVAEVTEKAVNGVAVPVPVAAAPSPEIAAAPVTAPEPVSLPATGVDRARSRGYWVAAAMVAAALAAGVYFSTRRAPDATAAAPVVPTVAVLPFLDISPNKDQGYFVDGLTEELTDHLSRVPGMRVVARTTSFTYQSRPEDLRKVAKDLGAQNLLEGSVRRDGEQLRITAQLIDASGKHIWSQTYDRKREEIFAIQQEVSSAIAAVLSAAVGATTTPTTRGGTHNVDAYDAYITARAALTDPALIQGEKLTFGITQLERATQFDPQFALAWAWQAIAYHRAGFLPGHGRPDLKTKANHAAVRAYEIAPDNSWVLVAAALKSMSELDWAAAEEKFARARAAATGSENPWACSGCFALTVGRTEEALTYLREASDADPLFAANPIAVAQTYEFRGEFDQADAELAASANLSGAEPMVSYRMHSLAFARHDLALIHSTAERLPSHSSFRYLVAEIDQPQKLLAELDDEVKTRPPDAGSGYFIPSAIYYAYFGKPQKALDTIRFAAFDATNTRIIWHPVFSEMRRLPGFKQLVIDLKMVDFWRKTGKWGDFCKPSGSDDFECH